MSYLGYGPRIAIGNGGLRVRVRERGVLPVREAGRGDERDESRFIKVLWSFL
jgi:hypothetical protein